MKSRATFVHLILSLTLTTSVLAGPVDVAQRVTNALFVQPLRIQKAEFVVSTEAFAAECAPHALIIKVLVPAKSGRREVLKVSMVIVVDRLEFLSAKGAALEEAKAVSGDDAMERSLRFLAGLNGWRTVEEPSRRAKQGYVERRMRDPAPRERHELDVKTIVFKENTGVPVLIGTPPSPTTVNCGKR